MANLATATQKATSTVVVGGSVGLTYNIIIRVRLRAPLKTYTGGSSPQTYVQLGGTPASDTVETVKLTVSNPAATYYLNKGTSGSPEGCVFIDYRLPITVATGATLTLEIDTIDAVVPGTLVIGEDSVEDPENDILDDFSGVFCQIDHSAEYISVTTTEVVGGGVRGFKFAGYSEDVYKAGAEQ